MLGHQASSSWVFLHFTMLKIGYFCPLHAEKISTFSAALIRVNGGYVIQLKYDVCFGLLTYTHTPPTVSLP